MKITINTKLLLVNFFTHAQRLDCESTAGYAGVADSFYGAIDIFNNPRGNARYPDQNFIPVATVTSDTIYTAVSIHFRKLNGIANG